jgi:hypothetical protein
MEALEPFGRLIGLGGSGLQALGQLQQGDAEHEASQFRARQIDQARHVSLQQAGQREDAVRRRGRRILGSQRAAFAQSGGGMGGSAADVMRQSGVEAELDALTTRYEGQLQAAGLYNAGQAERFRGRQARKASYYAAAGTALGGSGEYLGSS